MHQPVGERARQAVALTMQKFEELLQRMGERGADLLREYFQAPEL